MVEVDDLPDSLLLQIMTYLDFPTIVTAGNVNRRFYRLSQDTRFWKRLDCADLGRLTLNGLRKIIRRPSAVHIVSMRWEGYLRRPPTHQRGSTTGRPSRLQAATPAFLFELSQRCPNLRELHITYAELGAVTLRDFPTALEFLGFEGCVTPLDFFGPLNDQNVLPNLKGLDLSYCHNLSSSSPYSFPGILSRQMLTTLQLRHCFKISTDGLADVPVRLPNLQTLNVSDLTIIEADFMRLLAENAKSLTRLDISFCHAIDTAAFSPLATSNVCRLTKLYAIETKLNDDALTLLAQHQPQLKYLNVVKTGCTVEGITAFNQMNPGCLVEHKSSQTCEKVGASFWWIDMRYSEDVNEQEPPEAMQQ